MNSSARSRRSISRKIEGRSEASLTCLGLLLLWDSSLTPLGLRYKVGQPREDYVHYDVVSLSHDADCAGRFHQ